MRKTSLKIICATAMASAGFTGWVALAETQNDKPTMGQGTLPGCVGTYYAMAKMTNGSGSFWLTPPANATNGVFKDISGFPSPYAYSLIVMRKNDLTSWCTNSTSTTNGLSFPVTGSTTYSLTAYVNSHTPPPSSSQPLVLQITWH